VGTPEPVDPAVAPEPTPKLEPRLMRLPKFVAEVPSAERDVAAAEVPADTCGDAPVPPALTGILGWIRGWSRLPPPPPPPLPPPPPPLPLLPNGE
jgi:hypothetical protein